MDLYVTGVSHFDPLAKGRLSEYLAHLKRLHETPPVFVGVEFDECHFRQFAAQRGEFRKLLVEVDPALSKVELDIYAESLAYEGDAHVATFPTAKTLWLDEGRIVEQDDIDTYARRRVKTYLQLTNRKLAGALSELSRQFVAAQDQDLDLRRSKKFADKVCGNIGESGTWALTITGGNHANPDIAGSMANLLVAAGLRPIFRILY